MNQIQKTLSHPSLYPSVWIARLSHTLCTPVKSHILGKDPGSVNICHSYQSLFLCKPAFLNVYCPASNISPASFVYFCAYRRGQPGHEFFPGCFAVTSRIAVIPHTPPSAHFSALFFIFFSIILHVYVCLYMHVLLRIRRGQEGVPDPLDLQLQMVATHLTWVLSKSREHS